MSTTKFRTDIQGLRALAVSVVVLNHAFPKIVPGGYIGVDIFFVISGFLISRNIVRDLEGGRFSILEFYRRRVRRIFPALFIVLAATLAAGWLMLDPAAYSELAKTAIATTFFVSNFAFYKLTGYFDGAAEFKPLLHMWSLAVEEQFYIFFPLFLILLWQRIGRTYSSILLTISAIISLIIAEFLIRHSPSAAYYMLPPRAVELLIGVIAGIGGVPQIRSQMARNVASLGGIAMMLIPISIFTPLTPFPGAASLLPCLGATLIIYSGHAERTIAGKILAFPPFVYIGALSYSLYLWHWPVLVYSRLALGSDLPWTWGLTAIVVSVGLASLTYHFVEKPFLTPWGQRLHYLRFGGAQMVLVTTAGTLILMLHGLPTRFSPAALKLIAASNDFNQRRESCHYDGYGPLPVYGKSCIFGSNTATPDIAVWGDSHGAELSSYLGRRAAPFGRSLRELTSSACPPAQDFAPPGRSQCAELNRRVLSGLTADKSIKTVILVANGQIYRDTGSLERGLRLSATALLNAHKAVIVLKQTPLMDFSAPSKAALNVNYGLPIEDLGIETQTAIQKAKFYDEMVDRLGRDFRVTTFDPKSSLCDAQRCRVYDKSQGILYFNPDHLSLAGVNVAFGNLASKLYPNTVR